MQYIDYYDTMGKEKRATYKCICGNTFVAHIRSVNRGRTKSCGCLSRKLNSESHTKHGHTKSNIHSLEYNTWNSMIQRCTNVNHKCYKHYGGRGISVCDSRKDFSIFLRDMGRRDKGLTLDRIDNNGNYEPGNCKRSTMKEQCNNRRKKTFIN